MTSDPRRCRNVAVRASKRDRLLRGGLKWPESGSEADQVQTRASSSVPVILTGRASRLSVGASPSGSSSWVVAASGTVGRGIVVLFFQPRMGRSPIPWQAGPRQMQQTPPGVPARTAEVLPRPLVLPPGIGSTVPARHRRPCSWQPLPRRPFAVRGSCRRFSSPSPIPQTRRSLWRTSCGVSRGHSRCRCARNGKRQSRRTPDTSGCRQHFWPVG